MLTEEQIEFQLDRIAPPPATMMLMMAALAKEDVSFAEIEQITKKDPSLMMHLLRVANSAFYAGMRQVKTARDAISRLGLRGVRQIATALSMRKVVPLVIEGYETSAQDFLRRSLCVGQMSERLRNFCGLGNADVAFTAGLLHDVGILVTGSLLVGTALSPDESTTEVMSFEERERAILSLNHCDLGAALLARWNLPEVYQFVARWHHDLKDAPQGPHLKLAAAVHLSDVCARSLSIGGDKSGLLYRLDPSAYDILGVDPELTEKWMIDIVENLPFIDATVDVMA